MEEDDIDIEGDFDLKSTALSDAGDDDLPSKSAHLQPEFTQHPWVLEQGWTLDNGIDEKSKAVIEKMLQEEQFYIDGKTTEVSVPVTSPPRPANVPLSHKKLWTEEEKDMFFKGLEMFGHSWSKISSLIPTRSSQQVKYFAQHHLKQKNKSSMSTKPQSQVSQSVHQMLSSVTTAQPTVTSLMPKGKKVDGQKAVRRKLNTPEKQFLPKSRLGKERNTKTRKQPTGGVTVSHSLEVIRINKVSDDSCDEEIDVIDTSDTNDSPDGWTAVGSSGLGERHSDPGENNSDPGGNSSEPGESHSDPGKSYVGIDRVTCLEADTDEQTEDDTKVYTSCGDDASVRRDTVSKKQPYRHTDVVCTNSETMNDVYPSVTLLSALDTRCITMETACGCSNIHTHSQCGSESTSGSTHCSDIDVSLRLSPCPPVTGIYPGVVECSTDIDPSLPGPEGAQAEAGDCCFPDHIDGLISMEIANMGEAVLSSVEQGQTDACEGRQVQENTPDGLSSGTSLSIGTGDTISVTVGDTLSVMTGATVSTEVGDTVPVNTGDTVPVKAGDSVSIEAGDSEEEEDDEEHLGECAVLTSSGDLVYMVNPTSEVVLASGEISDQEQLIHSEFFDNRPGLKTPDRYLRIRTYIIDSWRRCKPSYLTKTSVRPGLRNCGDVNCIGRIHSYLEQLGAINFGCSQVQYNRPVRVVPSKVTRDATSEEEQQCVTTERLATIHARKRRVRDEQGNWVDEGDLEGKTIQHDNIASSSQHPTSRTTKVRRLYDPFVLVPCQRFGITHHAPFHVVIDYSALLIMDVHAHLSKTEVIGLLGGEYSSEEGELHVTTAQPCDSISTGMQCEMDPVSQTEACDAIRAMGQVVVGWYHSHPTFAPNPSVRDLETQHKFQGWFAKGGSPFIGVIVNPYDKQTPSHRSQFKCLVVCSDGDVNGAVTNTGVPYEFDFDSSHTHWNDDTVLTQVTQLTCSYSTYVNRVNLLQRMTPMTSFIFLDKIVQTVELYLPEEHRTDPERSLTKTIGKTLTDAFTNCETTVDCPSELDTNG